MVVLHCMQEIKKHVKSLCSQHWLTRQFLRGNSRNSSFTSCVKKCEIFGVFLLMDWFSFEGFSIQEVWKTSTFLKRISTNQTITWMTTLRMLPTWHRIRYGVLFFRTGTTWSLHFLSNTEKCLLFSNVTTSAYNSINKIIYFTVSLGLTLYFLWT